MDQVVDLAGAVGGAVEGMVQITIQSTYDVLSISIDNPTSALFQVDGILSVVAM